MITGICRFTKGEFSQDALDEVENKGNELYKDPVAPPSSGIVINTLDEIWDDMHGYNTGYVSNMATSYGQFNGPYDNPKADWTMAERGQGPYDSLNVWVEIEAAGDGSGCCEDKNRAVNARVELGYTRGYIRVGGVWQLYTVDGTRQTGGEDGYPNEGADSNYSRKTCDPDIYDWSVTSIRKTEPSGYYSLQPRGYKRWHGWVKKTSLPDYRDIEVIYGSVYVRLIVDDPSEEDDRNIADYVVHISGDIRKWSDEEGKNIYIGDVIISRYKKVPTNGDWIPISFITGFGENLTDTQRKAELAANPPPLFTTP